MHRYCSRLFNDTSVFCPDAGSTAGTISCELIKKYIKFKKKSRSLYVIYNGVFCFVFFLEILYSSYYYISHSRFYGFFFIRFFTLYRAALLTLFSLRSVLISMFAKCNSTQYLFQKRTPWIQITLCRRIMYFF